MGWCCVELLHNEYYFGDAGVFHISYYRRVCVKMAEIGYKIDGHYCPLSYGCIGKRLRLSPHKKSRKELGQYLATVTSRFVDNVYIYCI